MSTSTVSAISDSTAASAATAGCSDSCLSDWKRRSNRRNAAHSTGPRTPEGKDRSSHNATTHGVYCHDLLLEGESADDFHTLREAYLDSLRPQDLLELGLVDRVVSAMWKLRRLQSAESREYADCIDELRAMGGREAREARETVTPAAALSASFHADAHAFERISQLEQRLQNMMHRALRELRLLRDSRRKDADLPPSPFSDLEQHTPSPRSSRERAGERGERCEQTNDVRLRAHPAPLPNPLPASGEREQDPARHAAAQPPDSIPQNEPTAVWAISPGNFPVSIPPTPGDNRYDDRPSGPTGLPILMESNP